MTRGEVHHLMDDAARFRVAARLRAQQSANERLARVLDAVAAGASGIPGDAIEKEPVDSVTDAIATLRGPLPADLQTLATAAAGGSAQVADPIRSDAAPSSVAKSDAIRAAYVAVGDASGAAALLFTTGRLMFEGAACDLAVDRMRTYARVTKALNALLPQIMAWELREEGLACHCVCPMCGLGACGCIWASLHNIDVASGGPGLAEPDERGIPLRSPPRSGSELDVAGVKQWDRITSVDDQAVRSPGELTTALRQHSIGEEVRLKIQHHDDSREVVVRHASDLP